MTVQSKTGRLGVVRSRSVARYSFVEAKLRGMGKNVTLTMHPGTGHAFMAPHNALGTLNAELAAQIWPKVVSFLHDTLG